MSLGVTSINQIMDTGSLGNTLKNHDIIALCIWAKLDRQGQRLALKICCIVYSLLTLSAGFAIVARVAHAAPGDTRAVAAAPAAALGQLIARVAALPISCGRVAAADLELDLVRGAVIVVEGDEPVAGLQEEGLGAGDRVLEVE